MRLYFERWPDLPGCLLWHRLLCSVKQWTFHLTGFTDGAKLEERKERKKERKREGEERRLSPFPSWICFITDWLTVSPPSNAVIDKNAARVHFDKEKCNEFHWSDLQSIETERRQPNKTPGQSKELTSTTDWTHARTCTLSIHERQGKERETFYNLLQFLWYTSGWKDGWGKTLCIKDEEERMRQLVTTATATAAAVAVAVRKEEETRVRENRSHTHETH